MSDKRAVLSLFLEAAQSLADDDLAEAERGARELLHRDKSWAEPHHLLGEAARRRGAHAEAERHLRRAIELEPRAHHLHHALANVLQDSGRLREALEGYRRALRLAPHAADVWNDFGTAYFASGKPQLAVECYRKALQHGRQHVVALGNLGASLRALGDVRGALNAYRRELWARLKAALQKRTRTAGSVAEQAELWLARGSTRTAAMLADWALADDGGDSRALAVKAGIALRSGDAEAALGFLERALQAAPEDGALWLQMARVRRAMGDEKQAVDALRKSMSLGERGVGRELAQALAAAGEAAEALTLLRALVRERADADLWTALARLLLDGKDRVAAAEALDHALSLDPAAAPALAQLARLQLAQQQSAEALSLTERALELDPACADAHYWRGRAFVFLGRWSDAVECFQEARMLDAANPAAALWHARSLRWTGKVPEAQSVLREALGRSPGSFDLRSELIVSIFEGGEVARAREMLEHLLAENATHVGAVAAMAGLLNVEGRLEEAEAYAGRALAIDPNDAVAHQNLGVTLLKRSSFANGWDHYEWRAKVDELASVYSRFPYPAWDGGSVAGKSVLVYAEQGLGDEIMFASCIPDLMRQARHVVLECDPRLGPLFSRSFPGCAVFARERTETNAWTRSLEPQPDFQVPVGSLPRHFRRRPEDFPAHAGYLRADPANVERWRTRLQSMAGGPKLGLSWRGGLVKTGRVRRSLDLAQLLAILSTAGASFVSLQYGDVRDELASFERRHGIRILHEPQAIDDYDETAALVSALDGVISVCTSIVHLTGALGHPVLVMAPYSPEWRYGMSSETMPWYPSARILRQPGPDEWGPVLRQVQEALNAGWGSAWPGASR
ncbi:MAG TPA: tetratricopeptide repeat protein [Burkholderiales bacterium]|nr:tetratricopeptide repeat protein [Burkholderiales bacterium]